MIRAIITVRTTVKCTPMVQMQHHLRPHHAAQWSRLGYWYGLKISLSFLLCRLILSTISQLSNLHTSTGRGRRWSLWWRREPPPTKEQWRRHLEYPMHHGHVYCVLLYVTAVCLFLLNQLAESDINLLHANSVRVLDFSHFLRCSHSLCTPWLCPQPAHVKIFATTATEVSLRNVIGQVQAASGSKSRVK